MNNHPNHAPKSTPPSKQGKDTVKILMSTNTHPKADESTTPIKKSPIKPQKTT